MPKAVKYILVPYTEYVDLIEIKKKSHSVQNEVPKNPLTKRIEDILNDPELTDFEKFTNVIKKLTDMLHSKLSKPVSSDVKASVTVNPSASTSEHQKKS